MITQIQASTRRVRKTTGPQATGNGRDAGAPTPFETKMWETSQANNEQRIPNKRINNQHVREKLREDFEFKIPWQRYPAGNWAAANLCGVVLVNVLVQLGPQDEEISEIVPDFLLETDCLHPLLDLWGKGHTCVVYSNAKENVIKRRRVLNKTSRLQIFSTENLIEGSEG